MVRITSLFPADEVLGPEFNPVRNAPHHDAGDGALRSGKHGGHYSHTKE
jgi:hypothetical protein